MRSPSAGDRVIAIRDISTGFFSSLQKGNVGTVTRVSGFFTTEYDVTWDTGDRTTCRDGDIAHA